MWSWNCIVYSSELWWRELAFRQQVLEFWYDSLLKPNRRSYNCPPFSFFQSTRGCGWQMKTKPHFGRELKMERLCYKRHLLWDARFWNWRGQPCPCLLVKLCSMWISGFLGTHTLAMWREVTIIAWTPKKTLILSYSVITFSHPNRRISLFEVTRGTSILLCGAEGSGKSTLLRALAGRVKGSCAPFEWTPHLWFRFWLLGV